MKLIAFLSRLATLALAAFVLGVALDTQALALFAFTASTFVLLIAAGDYAPPAFRELRPIAAVVDFPPATGGETTAVEKRAA